MAAVVDYMTPLSHTLGPDAKLADVKSLMERYGIRHVAILDDGAVVGIVTMSDVFVLDHTLATDDETTRVSEVMTSEPYQVEGATSLGVVAREMTARRIGSAIVLHQGKPAGVFTSTDALRALGDALP